VFVVVALDAFPLAVADVLPITRRVLRFIDEDTHAWVCGVAQVFGAVVAIVALDFFAQVKSSCAAATI